MKFEVNINSLRMTSNEIGAVADKLMDYYDALNGFSLDKSFSGVTLSGINVTLNRNKDKLLSTSVKFHTAENQLKSILNLYIRTEERLLQKSPGLDSRTAEAGVANYDNNSGIYDSWGGYGGDQGDMAHNKSGFRFIFWRLFEDRDLIEFAKQYDRYAAYSDDQIIELFQEINAVGCGFVAVINNIILEYEGHDDEFQERFGFPLHDSNGDYNFNRLLIDFYATTDDRFYLNEPDGASALFIEAARPYFDNSQEFARIYHVDLYTDSSHSSFSAEAQQAVLDQYSDQDIATCSSGGLTPSAMNNRINGYLHEKGIDYTSSTSYPDHALSANEVQTYIDNGQNVNLLTENVHLYSNSDLSDSSASFVDSGHWMTITGVTEEGNYIVSSWGKKYYINPSEITDPDDLHNYVITDIRPS